MLGILIAISITVALGVIAEKVKTGKDIFDRDLSSNENSTKDFRNTVEYVYIHECSRNTNLYYPTRIK